MSKNEDPNAKEHQFMLHMFAVGMVVLLIAISVYGVWNGANPLEHSDAWVRYVSHYQTLIGGLLAVGAAYITVRQMRKSDERADNRHEDLMKLQMKGDIEDMKTLDYLFGVKLRGVNLAYTQIVERNVQSLNMAKDAAGEEQAFLDFLTDIYDYGMNFAKLLISSDWKKYEHVISAEGRDALAEIKVVIGRLNTEYTHSVEVGLLGERRMKKGKYEVDLIDRVEVDFQYLMMLIDTLKREISYKFD